MLNFSAGLAAVASCTNLATLRCGQVIECGYADISGSAVALPMQGYQVKGHSQAHTQEFWRGVL